MVGSAVYGGICCEWWDLLCLVGSAVNGGICCVRWDLLCLVGSTVNGEGVLHSTNLRRTNGYSQHRKFTIIRHIRMYICT